MPDNNFQDNPYLSARKEYGDRYGSLATNLPRNALTLSRFRRNYDVARKSK